MIVGGYVEQGQTVLDLGYGPGVFSMAMAKIVGEKGKVISVDIQDEMLQMLTRRSEQAGLGSRMQFINPNQINWRPRGGRFCPGVLYDSRSS
jgi:ubiquinone/menaquinone biosynthesis C-methylase UbiE